MNIDPNSEEDVLALAVDAWSKAQIVACRSAWKGHPLGAHFSEVLSQRPDLEDRLIVLLKSEHQLVVAYALLTLELMKSPALGCLPEELLTRKEKVTIVTGSFADKMELGAFARHIQKKWRTKELKGK